jgi:hypothetical protein
LRGPGVPPGVPGVGAAGGGESAGRGGTAGGSGGRVGPTDSGACPAVGAGGAGRGAVGTGGGPGSVMTSMRVGDDGAAPAGLAARSGDVVLHAASESAASSTDAVTPRLVIARLSLWRNAPPDLR